MDNKSQIPQDIEEKNTTISEDKAYENSYQEAPHQNVLCLIWRAPVPDPT